jgi:hypothetical protein
MVLVAIRRGHASVYLMKIRLERLSSNLYYSSDKKLYFIIASYP